MTVQERESLARIEAKLEDVQRRLRHAEESLDEIRVELSETRGAIRFGRAIVGFLGASGIGALFVWLSQQGAPK